MEIIFLGTGAAAPTLRRWPTSTAVVRSSEVLLFDCGEGAQVQYMKARLRPGKLSRIFISHLHGDHFYGLIGFLTSLQLAGRQKAVQIYGPEGTARYLAYMQEVSGFQFSYQVVVHEIQISDRNVRWNFETYSVTAMPLNHRMQSYGFRLEEHPLPGKFDEVAAERLGVPVGPQRGRLQNGESVRLAGGRTVAPDEVIGPQRPGKKIAICVDTAPCENSAVLASSVDVLVHEATYDETRVDLARRTGHSTSAQAASVARQAGARKLVLTHISARYGAEDEDRLLSQAQKVFPETTVGNDLLRIIV